MPLLFRTGDYAVMKKAGLTLVEIIIAMSVFFLGALFAFRMFQLAILSSCSIGDDAIATTLAEKKFEETRSWAYESPAGDFNYYAGDWNTLNTTESEPGLPQFQIRREITEKILYSPSENDMLNKKMSLSARNVLINVMWTSGGTERTFTLVSTIAAPVRILDSVTVEQAGPLPHPNPILLAPYESVTFIVKGFDSSGREISDLAWRWYVAPETGNGTISYTELGTYATFSNYVTSPDGSTYTTVGTCRVYAEAKGGGETKSGYSVTLDLYAL